MMRAPATPEMIPARVQAALAFLYHCRTVTDQNDVSIPARKLSTREEAVMRGALQVLGQYFSGEMDFGDAPPTPPPPPPDEPPQPAPVPV